MVNIYHYSLFTFNNNKRKTANHIYQQIYINLCSILALKPKGNNLNTILLCAPKCSSLHPSQNPHIFMYINIKYLYKYILKRMYIDDNLIWKWNFDNTCAICESTREHIEFYPAPHLVGKNK